MYFTQNDLVKIEEWLKLRAIKDTQLPVAGSIKGNEELTIVQNRKNKILTINDFIKQVIRMGLYDIFNVTTFSKKSTLSLEEAVSLVPVKQRKLGLIITFYSKKCNWVIYQFKGVSLNQWSSINYWSSPIEEALEELVVYPDDEDLEGVRDGNRTFLKLKDKEYDPDNYSGKGRVILRKNLVGTEACSIDDEDHFINVLTQDMIDKENTIYIIQYDFDLMEETINMPHGCTLWFNGGTLNNGNVELNGTGIRGIDTLGEAGENLDLIPPYKAGQIITSESSSGVLKLDWYTGDKWITIATANQ